MTIENFTERLRPSRKTHPAIAYHRNATHTYTCKSQCTTYCARQCNAMQCSTCKSHIHVKQCNANNNHTPIGISNPLASPPPSPLPCSSFCARSDSFTIRLITHTQTPHILRPPMGSPAPPPESGGSRAPGVPPQGGRWWGRRMRIMGEEEDGGEGRGEGGEGCGGMRKRTTGGHYVPNTIVNASRIPTSPSRNDAQAS